jgi:hypothetical protein
MTNTLKILSIKKHMLKKHIKEKNIKYGECMDLGAVFLQE